MKKSIIISLIFILLLFAWSGSAWAEISLPTSNFSGNAETTATTGSDIGFFSLYNTVISNVNYLDGTSTTVNTTDESIIGITATISGATRTGDYTFSDAIISVSDGSFNYITATLSDIVFLTDGTKWYLNPGLDINDLSTLNLSNIVLNTDVDHPSRYIDELISVKGNSDAMGMKIILEVLSGNIEGDGYFDIFTGLIDGVLPAVEAPSGAKSIGYWKNHGDERGFFIRDAASDNIDILNVFDTDSALNYYLLKKGKKSMEEKAKQQLAALLLNVAASLNPAILLSTGELELIDPDYDLIPEGDGVGDTIGDAVIDVENAILTGDDLERAKDLADEINNREN